MRKGPDLNFKIFKRGESLTLSFSGPFEALCRRKGRLNFLKEIGSDPQRAAKELSFESDRILNSIKSLLEKPAGFDRAWIWSDLAYKDNAFFSIPFYERYLFPIHKKLIGFLNSHNMSVIFHSDGKIDGLIPYLLEAGVSAFYPLDEYADMDIAELSRRYGIRQAV